MKQRPALSETDVLIVKARCAVALAQYPQALRDAGGRLLERLSGPNWALEWSLPRWLGDALGLEAGLSLELVQSNVYGLAYVRLQDDLADGEIVPEGGNTALLLAAALHQEWILQLARLFCRESRFWQLFGCYMANWICATLDSHGPLAPDLRAAGEDELLRLAGRGAPLKISAAGACLLAGREALIPGLDVGLDHLLAGAVLLDHAVDWAADLEAGRYNAFIAYASGLPQVAEHREANRHAVLQEIYAGKAARPYFRALEEQLQSARESLDEVSCPALDAYLVWLQAEAKAYHRRMRREAMVMLRAATEKLFGTADVEAPQAGPIPRGSPAERFHEKGGR